MYGECVCPNHQESCGLLPQGGVMPPYLNLVMVNLNDSAVGTLFAGADVIDGRVTNIRTAIPITWR